MFKNQFYFKSTKNLWPPFRLPKPVTQQDLTDQASNATEQTAEEKNESAFLTCSNKELLKQMRVDYELAAKSKLLNTKSLHAMILTILYEVIKV